jgi:hypothetical protein
MPIRAISPFHQHRERGSSTPRASEALLAPSRPWVSIQQARRDPGALSPRAILSLQRAIGNRAIGELLRGAPRAAATPSAPPPTMQRKVEATDKEPIRYFSSYEQQLIKDGHLSGPLSASYATEKEAEARDLHMKGRWEDRQKRSGGKEETESTVRVKPWIATVEYKAGALAETAADIDLHLVEAHVADIWGKVGVTLHYDLPAPLDIVLSKLPQEYANDEEFTLEVNKVIRPTINEAVARDDKEKKKGIQVVFVPTNDRWGFTYYPGKESSFDAPLTIVATKSAGVGVNRKLGEERVVPTPPGDFVPLDIILDTAHEIGHAFGLKHAETSKEVHLLMHKALYHTIGNAAKMSEETAEKLLKGRIEKKEGVAGLHKRKGAIGEHPGEIWTMMHGPDLTPEQVKAVLESVKTKRYLG